ncbi:DNA-binding response regulator, LytR/AlgR family [Flaviramulus basaltis]|uniref:DNA-binding response regulator, LytR/AlgR family n=1 Tax=Flaviramulus basaltis TaxID=369401 RepID=A0A1K2IIJ7_9FLAO|nr:LytTR family DNA-binding domain-containing protein [Flaviramulus basaltis]SFZ92223.1 DNA-binding response regulator, LytR/AlgR family [Flaviramulus basaltis]
MITILIIEDEIKTAKELKKYIEQSPYNAVVLDVKQSIKASVKWLKENNAPDLIFSDIQLADGLSFEIFKLVEIQSPIIFCTAFDEYAIEAFKTHSIDYLLKPIDNSKLNLSLKKYQDIKALFEGNIQQTQESIKNAIQQLDVNYKKTILVHYQDKIIPLKTEDLAYINYDLGNVYLVTFQGKKYVINQTLDELESILNPGNFHRVNRQFIVNRKAINTIENYFSRRLLLKLTLPTESAIIVSKTKSPLLLKWIENF